MNFNMPGTLQFDRQILSGLADDSMQHGASIEDLYSALANSTLDAGKNNQTSLVVHAGQIVVEAPSISPEFNNEQLHEFFLAHPALETIAVVNDGVPVAMVNRNAFMEQYGRPFTRELYGKKECLIFADEAPLIMPADTPIEVLVRHAVRPDSRVMKDGFICTQAGRYVGLGTGMSLLRAMADIEAEKTRQLLSSIDYASAIQQSSLRSSDQALAATLPQAQLTWLPRDVVGGDCYFFRATKDGMFGAIIDCTGHGVPGAFMTLITLAYLENQITSGDAEPDPAVILSGLNRYIKKILGQNHLEAEHNVPLAGKSDDGLDAFMFTLTEGGRSLHYAGARLEMAMAQPGKAEVKLFEGDKMGVGYQDTPDDFAFALKHRNLPAGYRALVTTDGVIDQIGGPKNIAHGRKRLYQLLTEQQQQSPEDFTTTLLRRVTSWQGAQRRRDDVCFLVL
jgi:serine phosphatase RsbU (regulator of sigma subunit)